MTKITCIFGKSGSGKNSIAKEILKLQPDRYTKVITCTTRPPREDEVNGVDYYFMTPEEFNNREMIEKTEFNNWWYGTDLFTFVDNKINIWVANPTGIKTLLNLGIEMNIYYVDAPPKIRLLRALNREANPDVEEIIRRFSADNLDFRADKLRDIIPFEVIENVGGISDCAKQIISLDENN